ncbi:MAG: hypothetical protein QOK03_2935 [Candidatus Binataceae bacterium]|nr:hypothetical protein [Candidatus Binataceae bacterium]
MTRRTYIYGTKTLRRESRAAQDIQLHALTVFPVATAV